MQKIYMFHLHIIWHVVELSAHVSQADGLTVVCEASVPPKSPT